jgi:hypothetical protein
VPYGMSFSGALGCLGLCLVEESICLLVGGSLVALRVLLCGRWYLVPLVLTLERNE